ncbi:uncharacterized protein M421DRAFT_219253 [Didymella exigua CBS 183.55]|uniref:Uncharacterized protein n=1 Tax=Didymella exigua CBS 183.55 TaxID=1150837 RepID=A0A6A5RGB8_9PLEO|nr:uncharacterized protein M421DRAFT_219253 [Didymella exigua CBS 183.55]KAF1926198.1 hypothetical protein M421DRAFT_219253 [Didymella exigua CBS 183.55]
MGASSPLVCGVRPRAETGDRLESGCVVGWELVLQGALSWSWDVESTAEWAAGLLAGWCGVGEGIVVRWMMMMHVCYCCAEAWLHVLDLETALPSFVFFLPASTTATGYVAVLPTRVLPRVPMSTMQLRSRKRRAEIAAGVSQDSTAACRSTLTGCCRSSRANDMSVVLDGG